VRNTQKVTAAFSRAEIASPLAISRRRRRRRDTVTNEDGYRTRTPGLEK
jgi:hypothetical protein